MSDNDQAAAETDGWHDFTLEQARDFLDEMKSQHPGRWTGLGRIAEQMTAECVKLRAEVERLKKELDDEMGKAGEWIDIRTHRERVSAAVARISDHARKMEAERDAEKARADKAEADRVIAILDQRKAEAQRDRLAGLLDDVVSGVETLLLPHWPEMMRKVVKGAMVGRHGLAHVAARAALAEVGK